MEKKIFYNGLSVIVSDNGVDFYNGETHKKLNVCYNKSLGRSTVWLKDRNVYTYRLVARAFPEICGEWFEGCEIHHLDENPDNNRADNLRVLSEIEHHNQHLDESISHLPEYKGQNDKTVYQYSLSGEFIKEWCSTAVAGRTLGISHKAIAKAARGESDTSGDYIWCYEYKDKVDPILPSSERIKQGNYHPISQYTKSGAWVRDYDSLKEACESIGITHSGNIVSCCIGQRKTAYGYIWKYTT